MRFKKKRTSTQLISYAKQLGWFYESQRGSHVKYKHPKMPRHLVIPHPRKDIPIGTYNQIVKIIELACKEEN